MDAGASTSNNPKIRVLNHKDYKTWKIRIRSIYAYSGITGFFKTLFAYSEHFFAYDNTKKASHALIITNIKFHIFLLQPVLKVLL